MSNKHLRREPLLVQTKRSINSASCSIQEPEPVVSRASPSDTQRLDCLWTWMFHSAIFANNHRLTFPSVFISTVAQWSLHLVRTTFVYLYQ